MQAPNQHDRASVKVPDNFRESVLLQRVRSRAPGWRSAFTVLLERHRATVYRRCLFRLRDAHDAEDAVQETMLQALRGVDGFAGRSRFDTWLVAIADNECNSLAQRRKRHEYSDHLRSLIRLYEEHQRASAAIDPHAACRVRETLSRLPPKAREVLGLRFFGEASLDEIAQTLGISLSAAKMRLYRALELFEVGYRREGASADPDGGSAEAAR